MKPGSQSSALSRAAGSCGQEVPARDSLRPCERSAGIVDLQPATNMTGLGASFFGCRYSLISFRFLAGLILMLVARWKIIRDVFGYCVRPKRHPYGGR